MSRRVCHMSHVVCLVCHVSDIHVMFTCHSTLFVFMSCKLGIYNIRQSIRVGHVMTCHVGVSQIVVLSVVSVEGDVMCV